MSLEIVLGAQPLRDRASARAQRGFVGEALRADPVDAIVQDHRLSGVNDRRPAGAGGFAFVEFHERSVTIDAVVSRTEPYNCML